MVNTPHDSGGRRQKIEAVLLYKRTQDAPVHPGYWALFGGEVEEGEDEKKALQREIIDEKELEVTHLSENDFRQLLQIAEHVADVRVIRDEDEGELLIRYFKTHLDHDMDSLKLGKPIGMPGRG